MPAPLQYAMWPYHPELLERSVPRYTSYPTAAEFRPVDADFHAAGFDAIAEGAPISLYVHVPYCERICWYCGCNTGAANRPARLAAYLAALHAEIDCIADRLGTRRPITQIAFGGGSPNALAPVDFVRLLDHLTIAFGAIGARLSIELDPRSLDGEWIETIGRAGISHASLGIQTFEPSLQQAIGRIQPLESVKSAVSGLRSAGVQSLNFDLMYGLPGQAVDDLDRTLDHAIALQPDRIALFGYAHLPQLLPRQRRIDDRALPGARLRFEMAARGFERLVEAGYHPIGFDHFARPTDGLARAAARKGVRRNFQGFTDDPAETLVGIGASAISAFPDRFVQNDKNSGGYRVRSAEGALSGAAGTVRSLADRHREAVISSLLCCGEARIGPASLDPVHRKLIDRMHKHNLLSLTNDRLVISEEGRPYSRTIASLFDAYRRVEENRFSKAV